MDMVLLKSVSTRLGVKPETVVDLLTNGYSLVMNHDEPFKFVRDRNLQQLVNTYRERKDQAIFDLEKSRTMRQEAEALLNDLLQQKDAKENLAMMSSGLLPEILPPGEMHRRLRDIP